MQLHELDRILAASEARIIEEWRTFLQFASISAEPDYDDDCRRCATWLRDHIEGIGFEVELLETGTKPVVYGERKGPPGAPVVLFYGHYDVQPVDPLSAWQSPPFDPQLRDGRMYARGAQDNKGQVFFALKAMEALIQADALPVTLRVCIEGEEECSSEGFSRRLTDWSNKLAADVLLVCDTGSLAPGRHAIVMGLRGILQMGLALRGPRQDLHSGLHGGKAPNPAAAMVRLLASLHDAEGRIAVPGYYDEVEPPSDEERRLAAAAEGDAGQYEADTGVRPVGGETGVSAAERVGFRPTLEINGIHAGYGGPGMKTIIPALAEAKITSRTVARQDGQRCLEAVVAHLRAHAPAGLTLDILQAGVAGPPLRVRMDSPVIALARDVLRELAGTEPAFLWEGASIPIVAGLRDASGAEPLLVGFGLEEDRIHAPNESFSLEQFRTGFRYMGRLLSVLGQARRLR